MGLYRTSGVYCTQCEAEGFRRITYFLDRPDVLASTRSTSRRQGRQPAAAVERQLPRRRRLRRRPAFAAWHDPHPKPSYLFALVAGDLGVVEDTFVTMSGREVALKIYVEHGKEPAPPMPWMR
jgi:aminopeptidase N